MLSWSRLWSLLRCCVWATWVVSLLPVAADLVCLRLPSLGSTLSAAYCVVVLSLSRLGAGGIVLSAMAEVNTKLCALYLLRAVSLFGLPVVFPAFWLLGLVLRWSAVLALGRRVTWDRLDWRGFVGGGVYRYVAHPMTWGMFAYSLACLDFSDVWVGARVLLSLLGAAGIYVLESRWLSREVFGSDLSWSEYRAIARTGIHAV